MLYKARSAILGEGSQFGVEKLPVEVVDVTDLLCR